MLSGPYGIILDLHSCPKVQGKLWGEINIIMRSSNIVLEEQTFNNWYSSTFDFFFFPLVQTLESCYNVRLFVHRWWRFGIGLRKQWCQAWLNGLRSLCWFIYFVRLRIFLITAFFSRVCLSSRMGCF